MLRERKTALKSKVAEKDVKAILALKDVMSDDKVSIFGSLDFKNADELQKVFKIMNKEQVNEILKRTAPLYEVAN